MSRALVSPGFKFPAWIPFGTPPQPPCESRDRIIGEPYNLKPYEVGRFLGKNIRDEFIIIYYNIRVAVL